MNFSSLFQNFADFLYRLLRWTLFAYIEIINRSVDYVFDEKKHISSYFFTKYKSFSFTLYLLGLVVIIFGLNTSMGFLDAYTVWYMFILYFFTAFILNLILSSFGILVKFGDEQSEKPRFIRFIFFDLGLRVNILFRLFIELLQRNFNPVYGSWGSGFAICCLIFISIGFFVIDSFWSFGGHFLNLNHFNYVSYFSEVQSVVFFDSRYKFYFTDGLTSVFCFLTLLVLPVCAGACYTARVESGILLVLALSTCLFVFLVFNTTDFFLFFVVFEFLLFPIFYLIGQWGSRSERVNAAYFLYLFTAFGSLFFILAILLIGLNVGFFSYYDLIEELKSLNPVVREIIWVCCFIAFAVKVPLIPFHSWLTVAHVEAPTVGSVLLASLLLKVGGYGMIRFLISWLPDVTFLYQSFVVLICVWGGLFAVFNAFRQVDLKRFIAYTSIAHMHFLILALFTLTDFGYTASIHGMISHGLIAAGLFFLVGSLYERYGVRLTLYLRQLVFSMPVFSLFWSLFLFANVGLPFFSGFVNELLGFLAIFLYNAQIAFFCIVTFFGSAVYAFIMQLNILMGGGNWWVSLFSFEPDLSRREVYILLFLLVWIILLGCFPEIVLNSFIF